MKIAYFDCIGGISGDMILGALIDAGIPEEEFKKFLSALDLPPFELKIRKVKKGAIVSTKVDINSSSKMDFEEMVKVIKKASLPSSIKEKSLYILSRLREAEGKIHGQEIKEVHFHEIGNVDTVIDILGGMWGINFLNIEEVHCSPLPVGSGLFQSSHGYLPIPAPATVELLKGTPIVGKNSHYELVTPTGAAFITTVAKRFGPLPFMRIETVGYGAGERELPFPNVLRIIIGEKLEKNKFEDSIMVLETNIDDMSPELAGYLMERLYEEGATEVFFTPVYMKKNRPGILLTVLADEIKLERLTETIFKETTTLGIRMRKSQRLILKRDVQKVETPWGEVRVKVGKLGKQIVGVSLEFEDLKKIAKKEKLPLKDIYRETIRKFYESIPKQDH